MHPSDSLVTTACGGRHGNAVTDALLTALFAPWHQLGLQNKPSQRCGLINLTGCQLEHVQRGLRGRGEFQHLLIASGVSSIALMWLSEWGQV